MYLKKSHYNYIVENEGDFILFNTRTLAMIAMNDEEMKKFENIQDGKEKSGEFEQELYELGFLVDYNSNEKEILKYRLNKGRFKNDVLSLTIAPTLNCNFKCPYCYEKQAEKEKVNVSLMNQEIMEKVVKFVQHRIKKCKKLFIIWYGGEPLIGFEVIKKLTNNFKELCNNMEIEYEANMITNGYLLDQFEVEELKKLDITSFQITIDGNKELHDQRRILRSGKGSYDRILQNIETYSKYFNISIRINVDKTNFAYMDKLIEDIRQRSLFEKVYIYMSPVTKDDGFDNDCFKKEEFSKLDYNFRKKLKDVGIRKHISSKIKSCSNYCGADSENAYVIDDQGEIYKCFSDIGNKMFSIGNVTEKKQKNSYIYYKYMTYDPMEDEKCKTCNILPLCMGGCPHYRLNDMERCSEYKYSLDKEILAIYKETILENEEENKTNLSNVPK
ncbi:MAG: SPASM domain-containing protein [Clostridiales bacterium]|nr:SPASM domain-containing protein [Clostridiales bacterium]